MAREHTVTYHPEFFPALWSGDQRFLLHYDDQGYHAGDTLLVQEASVLHGPTGRSLTFLVTYLCCGEPGLQPGYVCMSLQEVRRGIALTDAAMEGTTHAQR